MQMSIIMESEDEKNQSQLFDTMRFNSLEEPTHEVKVNEIEFTPLVDEPSVKLIKAQTVPKAKGPEPKPKEIEATAKVELPNVPTIQMQEDKAIELPRVVVRPENIEIQKEYSFAEKVLSAGSAAKSKEAVRIPEIRQAVQPRVMSVTAGVCAFQMNIAKGPSK